MIAAIPHSVDVLVGFVVGAILLVGVLSWLRSIFNGWLNNKIDRRAYLREHGFDSEEQLLRHNDQLQIDYLQDRLNELGIERFMEIYPEAGLGEADDMSGRVEVQPRTEVLRRFSFYGRESGPRGSVNRAVFAPRAGAAT